MRITVDLDRGQIIEYITNNFLRLVKFAYSWFTTDGEVIGCIIGVFHIIIGIGLAILVIISHTVYPSTYLQIFVFVMLVIILVQHITLKVCIFTLAEETLTNTGTIFHKTVSDLMNFLGITLDNLLTNLVIIEIIAVSCFALELIAKFSTYIQT